MISSVLNVLKRWLLLAVTACSAGCAVVGGDPSYRVPNDSVEGRVIDHDTGAPVVGAHVALQYMTNISNWPHLTDSTPYCYWSAVTITNEQGMYHFPPLDSVKWAKLSERPRYHQVTAYAEGFTFVDEYKNRKLQNAFEDGYNLAMARDSMSSGERIELLTELSVNVVCNFRAAPEEPGYAEFFRAIYDEASRRATSEQDRQKVNLICERAMMYDPINEILYPEFFPRPCSLDPVRFQKFREVQLREKRKICANKSQVSCDRDPAVGDVVD